VAANGSCYHKVTSIKGEQNFLLTKEKRKKNGNRQNGEQSKALILCVSSPYAGLNDVFSFVKALQLHRKVKHDESSPSKEENFYISSFFFAGGFTVQA
jgi:hypothetical protein